LLICIAAHAASEARAAAATSAGSELAARAETAGRITASAAARGRAAGAANAGIVARLPAGGHCDRPKYRICCNRQGHSSERCGAQQRAAQPAGLRTLGARRGLISKGVRLTRRRRDIARFIGKTPENQNQSEK
jgi:hypothetical protein